MTVANARHPIIANIFNMIKLNILNDKIGVSQDIASFRRVSFGSFAASVAPLAGLCRLMKKMGCSNATLVMVNFFPNFHAVRTLGTFSLQYPRSSPRKKFSERSFPQRDKT